MRQLLFTVLVCISLTSLANSEIAIQGTVLNEHFEPLSNASIVVTDKKVTSSESGLFTLNMARKDSYQIQISHPDYYSIVQTFSHFELTNKASNTAVISDIILVKKKADRVMFAFAGDVMMGRRYYKPYFGDNVLIHPNNKLADSKAIVQNIRPYMSIADYASVNLETQIANKEPKERAPKSVTFYSEPEILEALTWAGVDYVSLGNNHTYDYMDSGLQSTLAFLEASQLDYSGAGVNESTALTAHTTTINNTPFAMLGYVGWEGSANPTQTANSKHGGAAYGSMKNILESVNQQVSQNNVTLVQYHGSQEYANNPTGVTEQRLKSALDAGAALAIAHHPHVTQGLELYNNKLIAYSMGNFIFDQNFSATQHSFILYVWLDQGVFHRAEIVPLYVKGYKPTPATGMHRYTVMKRLRELSNQRNTPMLMSGGHGVIQSKAASASFKNPTTEQQFTLTMQANEQTAPLYQLPWNKTIKQVRLTDKNTAYRLGVNLINGSDFESFALFNSPERGWLFDRKQTTLNSFGASGNHSIKIKLMPNSTNMFGMQSFRRVYKASSPMTIKAKFNTQSPVEISFYWQGRKTRQKLFDAFENSPKHLINTVKLKGSNTWQNIELGFNSPRIGYKSYRVIAEIKNKAGEATEINIDDFALVEWQTAFSTIQTPSYYNTLSYQAAYIGVSKPTTTPITIGL